MNIYEKESMGITKIELGDDNVNLLAILFKVLRHPARLSILQLMKERQSVKVGINT